MTVDKSDLIDQAVLKELLSLAAGNLSELIDRFEQKVFAEGSLERGVSSSELREQLHQYAGSAGSLGLCGLAEKCRECEQALISGADASEVEVELLQEFAEESFSTVRGLIQSHLERDACD